MIARINCARFAWTSLAGAAGAFGASGAGAELQEVTTLASTIRTRFRIRISISFRRSIGDEDSKENRMTSLKSF
jgi:hypothetical protein